MPKKRSNAASGSYEVGYRRPPQQYQFKQGGTANPAGINQHTASSIARDMKRALERELNKQITIRQGKRSITVRQTIAGVSKLVGQFVEGNPRARRDLFLLCEKLGVELINRDALQGALEDVLSAEDEAVLTDFVKRHGGEYPVRAEPVRSLSSKDDHILGPPAEDPKLVTAQPANAISAQNPPTGESND